MLSVSLTLKVSLFQDYDGYDPIVASALAYPLVGGSPACRDAVASAFATLERKFDSDRPALAALFNTCGEVRTDGDVYLLHDYVSVRRSLELGLTDRLSVFIRKALSSTALGAG